MPDQRSASKPRGVVWLSLVAILVVLSTLRLWKLELDPPQTVVLGYSGQAHFRDEAAKAHEARNKAKWDSWSVSEVDEYGFWRAQSPAWVWGEYAWFRAFGVGLLQARLYVVVQSIVALALLMWLAMIRHGLPTAIATALLLGLNWAYLVYSRLALMEGALICWLLVATVGLSQLERQPRHAGRWAMLATAAMLIACTIKQTGLLVVPAFTVALLALGLRAAGQVAGLDDGGAPVRARVRARLRRPEARVILIAIVVLAGVLAMLVLNPEYQQRLAFNAEHFTVAREQSVLGRAAWTLLRGLFSFRLQLMYMTLAPMIMWLATLELIRIVVLALRPAWARRKGRPVPEARGALEQPADAIDYWMLAWAVFALLANLASPHRAVRFVLVLLPPAAWLAGALVGRAWAHEWSSRAWGRAARIGLVVLACLGVFETASRFVRWMHDREASAAWIGDEVTALIGDREAVVVGEFAAQVVFETDYKHFYVRPNQFNDDPEVIRALGITHTVSAPDGDFVEDVLEDETPDLLLGRRKLGTVTFRRHRLIVWELATPERREEVAVWRERQAKAEKRRQKRESRQAKQIAAQRNRLERAARACLPDPLPEDDTPRWLTPMPTNAKRGRPTRAN